MENYIEVAGKLVASSGIVYIVATLFYSFYLVFKKDMLAKAGLVIGFVGLIMQLTAFIIRFIEAYNRVDGKILRAIPITNLYESLFFFAMMMALFYIIFDIVKKNSALGAFAFAISGSVILFIDAIDAHSGATNLVPALQSNWLLAHVSLSFIAYACFAISAITSLLYLIITSTKKMRFSYFTWTIVLGISTAIVIFLIIKNSFNLNMDMLIANIVLYSFMIVFSVIYFVMGLKIKNIFSGISLDVENLEAISFKFIGVGFAIFTIGGLVFGAIWAEQSWGTYWSWDPKETWAFITWMVYAVYLHGRLYGRWTKEMASSLALIGFLVTIFTFLGVNLLLSGLHSYGSM